MSNLTVQEERTCKGLMDEGYDHLSQTMREHYTREHETFGKLKDADVDTLYGPRVSEVMRNALKKAIAEEKHDEVHAMHGLFQSLNDFENRDKPKERLASSNSSGGFDPTGIIWATLLMFAVPLFAVFVAIISG